MYGARSASETNAGAGRKGEKFSFRVVVVIDGSPLMTPEARILVEADGRIIHLAKYHYRIQIKKVLLPKICAFFPTVA